MRTTEQQEPSVQRTFQPVVIAPTYNNAASVIGVLDRIERVGAPMIVVDDGATDDTPMLLAEWARKPREVPVQVITHPNNRGKAAALQTGFTEAARLGFTHAVTMDTDGQLRPEEIPALLSAAEATPDALVLGRREKDIPGLPRSNLVGWYTSGLGLWLETGVVVQDSQCGLRVYPLRLFDVVRCRAGRFGFEAEIIARAVWAGCPLVDVPVTCHYPPQEESVSHLSPWRDGAKGFFMHWGLAIRRLIPRREPKLGGVATLSGGCPPGADAVRAIEVGEANRFGAARTPATGLTAWIQWASPLSLWRRIRSSRMEQLIASSAFAHGVFMACMPFGLWAFLAAAYGSKRLHHNLWAAMLGAALSIPPIGRMLAMIAITITYVPTHFAFPDFSAIPPGAPYAGTLFRAYPISWCVGGVLLGTALHWLTIVGLIGLFRLIKIRVS